MRPLLTFEVYTDRAALECFQPIRNLGNLLPPYPEEFFHPSGRILPGGSPQAST